MATNIPVNGTPPGGSGSGAVDSVNGSTGAVTLSKSDVGLSNVDNTSDAEKPVSTAVAAALDAHAAAPNPHPQYAAGNTPALTYTYTGVLSAPPIASPGTTEMVLASPTGKERVNGLLLSPANVSLTGIEFSELEFVGSNFNPNTMAALTSLSLPALTGVGGTFNPNTMIALTSLSLPALTTVGGNFNPSTMAALTSLSFPALTTVGGTFNPHTMAALTSLSFPALTTVGGTFNPNTMAALTSLIVPALEFVGSNFNPSTMAALTSLSFPALTTVGGTFNPNTMAALTSLSLPVIEVLGNGISTTSQTAALTTMEIGASLKLCGGNVTITSAALNQTSVDNLLVRLAALDGTNGTMLFGTGKTVTITGTSATPSAAGLAAKAILVARGCSVTHN